MVLSIYTWPLGVWGAAAPSVFSYHPFILFLFIPSLRSCDGVEGKTYMGYLGCKMLPGGAAAGSAEALRALNTHAGEGKCEEEQREGREGEEK